MPKYYFNKVAKQLYLNHPWHGCYPANLLHILKTLFPKNTSGGLLPNTGFESIDEWSNVSSKIIFDSKIKSCKVTFVKHELL